MAQRTTKSQVSGYRFLLRRLEHALVRRDVRMIHDPMGAHVKSLIVGLVLTLVALGAAVAISFFKPQGSVGDSKILLSKSSGQLYVLVNDQLHPALNLASARLAAGSAESPNSVSDKVLAKFARGPQLGIPGAPSSLSTRATSGPSQWAVCDKLDEPRNADEIAQVGVIGGTPHYTDPHPLGQNDAMYVHQGDDYFLIYRNSRAAVDSKDNIVRQALALGTVTARSVSPAMLDTLLPAQPITAPVIERAGRPVKFDLNGARIGDIVSASTVDSSGRDKLYVVLRDGVQQVSPFVADLIRAKESISSKPYEVSLAALANVPQVQQLSVDGYPDTAPHVIDGTRQSAMCLSWSKSGDDPATLSTGLANGFPVTDPDALVQTVTPSTTGRTADVAYIPPGAGDFVRTVGTAPGSTAQSSDFFVADTGVRYGVPVDAGPILGMSHPAAAPYAIVSLLPPGPALARSAALVARTDIQPGGGS